MADIKKLMEKIGFEPLIWAYEPSDHSDEDGIFVCWDGDEKVWKEYYFMPIGGYPSKPLYVGKELTGRAKNVVLEKYNTVDIITILIKIAENRLIGKPKCLKCGKTGKCSSRMLDGPDYYDEYSFECKHCGHKDSETEYGGSIMSTEDTSTTCPYCGKSH